jgi:hypothetical protein
MKADIEKALAKLELARQDINFARAQSGGHPSESFVINAYRQLDEAIALLKKATEGAD